MRDNEKGTCVFFFFSTGLDHMPQMHCIQEAYYATLFRRSHFCHQSVLIRATRETPSSERWNWVGKNHGR